MLEVICYSCIGLVIGFQCLLLFTCFVFMYAFAKGIEERDQKIEELQEMRNSSGNTHLVTQV